MQTPKVRVGPAARRDIDRQVIWFAAQAGEDTARRFAAAVVGSFAKLASSPETGSPQPSRDPMLAGLRKGRVAGFPKLLIFYLPQKDGIRVVRLFHAAQDWVAALDLD